MSITCSRFDWACDNVYPDVFFSPRASLADGSTYQYSDGSLVVTTGQTNRLFDHVAPSFGSYTLKLSSRHNARLAGETLP
ncbi:hypothetical protein B0F90DRAFT_1767783, partial [Multifurca ochricompacta]